MNKQPCDFLAVIGKVGINPFVAIPEHVSACLGKRTYIPVTGKLNNVAIRATLVPVGGGRHRLYVNGEMRKKAKVDVGDKVHLTLMFDAEPRLVPIPREFVDALLKNEKALAAFEKLPPSHQKEILDYLNYLKKPENLKRNIAKVLKTLAKNNNPLKT